MTDDRQDDASLNDREELAEEARAAVSILEQDDPPPEIRELLRTPQGRETVEQVVLMATMAVSEQHSGPLPSPRQLREYDLTLPGTAERIVQMAEREQQHRHEMLKDDAAFRDRAFTHVQQRETRGQAIGGGLAASVLLLGTYMTYLGHAGIAAGLAGTTLIGIAGVFVIRQQKKNQPPAPDSPPPDSDE